MKPFFVVFGKLPLPTSAFSRDSEPSWEGSHENHFVLTPLSGVSVQIPGQCGQSWHRQSSSWHTEDQTVVLRECGGLNTHGGCKGR